MTDIKESSRSARILVHKAFSYGKNLENNDTGHRISIRVADDIQLYTRCHRDTQQQVAKLDQAGGIAVWRRSNRFHSFINFACSAWQLSAIFNSMMTTLEPSSNATTTSEVTRSPTFQYGDRKHLNAPFYSCGWYLKKASEVRGGVIGGRIGTSWHDPERHWYCFTSSKGCRRRFLKMTEVVIGL